MMTLNLKLDSTFPRWRMKMVTKAQMAVMGDAGLPMWPVLCEDERGLLRMMWVAV
jgi:hypothetical protein